MPELLVEMGYEKSGTMHAQAIGDLTLIDFYYLLCVGKYTVKGKRNNTKQKYNSNSKTSFSSKGTRQGP